MKEQVIVYSSKPYDREYLRHPGLSFRHIPFRLTVETAPLAVGHPVVCIFVHDMADERVLAILKAGHVSMIALRCTGSENVNFEACRQMGLAVSTVPAYLLLHMVTCIECHGRYSPHSIAEHTIGLILAQLRHIPQSLRRVHSGNFSLDHRMIGHGRIPSTSPSL